MTAGENKRFLNEVKEIVRPLGIVFGDIGTSPIYTLTAVVLFLKPEQENIFGVISFIFWSLIIVVYIQYTWLAMNLSIRGEGGTIILQEILISLVKNKKQIRYVIFFSFIALSFIIGDGVITPAITILGAVEGIVLIPGLEHTPLAVILLITIAITFLLFAFQKRGTDRVSALFSPIMLVWFLSLAVSGLVSIVQFPGILRALSPDCALKFFLHHEALGFLVLSEVILSITGGEALYADMGHLGKNCIVKGWNFVFICLVLNYLGQGAHLILHPTTKSTLFGMILDESAILYIPFLIITIMASIIASQSMISAMFSIVYQGINTHIMPRLRVEHTSSQLSTQIYIGTVNWTLFMCVVLMILIFRESRHMALAYGLAVNVTMTLTALMLIWIYLLRKERFFALIAIFPAILDILFLGANLNKFHHGGYWSLIIACIPLSVILLFRSGQRVLYQALKPLPLEEFLTKYNELYKAGSKIPGTAIFFLRDYRSISPYILNTMFIHNIVYEYNIILSISTKELTALFGTLVKAFDDNPLMAKKAFAQTSRLLKNRSDISPDAAGKMVLNMSDELRTIKPQTANSQQMLDSARLEMLEGATDALIKRPDLQTEDMTTLATSTVKTFGSQSDSMSLPRVSHAFKNATGLLGKRKDINVNQMVSFMGQVQSSVPGIDGNSLQSRADIFGNACSILQTKEGLNFSHMEQLLKCNTEAKTNPEGFAVAGDFNKGAAEMGEGRDLDQVAPRQDVQPQKPAGETENRAEATGANQQTHKGQKQD